MMKADETRKVKASLDLSEIKETTNERP
jgi:hypothetical protein